MTSRGISSFIIRRDASVSPSTRFARSGFGRHDKDIIQMTSNEYTGKINGKIIELRFALSGKLSGLYKKRGDIVKKGELVAGLDKKQLQTELDKQLGDFEKVRAEFEIFNLQKGEPDNDIEKYLKAEKQAHLNISVKEVELAKAKLDQTDLFSPVEGIIIDDSNLVAGIYLTPSSNPIKVIETSSYFFEFEIDQKELPLFKEPKEIKVEIEGLDKQYSGISLPIVPREDGKLIVEVKLNDTSELFLGLKARGGIVK